MWLAGVGKNIAAFLLPIVQKHGAELLDQALPIALEIMQSYEANDAVDSSVKRQLAVQRLRDVLFKQGLATRQEIATSTLNWIVETALQKLRATQPAVVQ